MDQPPGLPHHFFTYRPAWPVGAPVAQPSTRHHRRTTLDLRLSGGRRFGVAVVVADGSPMAHLGVVTGCGYRGSSTTCSAPRSHLARGPCARENRIPNRCDKRGASRARNEGTSEGLTLELRCGSCRPQADGHERRQWRSVFHGKAIAWHHHGGCRRCAFHPAGLRVVKPELGRCSLSPHLVAGSHGLELSRAVIHKAVIGDRQVLAEIRQCSVPTNNPEFLRCILHVLMQRIGGCKPRRFSV